MPYPNDMEWQREMHSVLGTKACGSSHSTAMLPLQWKSGWSPATVKAFLEEVVLDVIPGKVPRLQCSVPGDIVWQDFDPTMPTDRSYDLTLEKLMVGCPITQERVIAYKCFIFTSIWSVQRAALYESHKENIFRARFTDASMEAMRRSETFKELCEAIGGLVEEQL
ncbi:hypothetical protein PG990_006956 [Apiospora arundinis]